MQHVGRWRKLGRYIKEMEKQLTTLNLCQKVEPIQNPIIELSQNEQMIHFPETVMDLLKRMTVQYAGGESNGFNWFGKSI